MTSAIVGRLRARRTLRAAALLPVLATVLALSGPAPARAQATVTIDVQETITVSDSVDVVPPAVISVEESISVSDEINVVPPAVIDVSEAVAVSDSLDIVPPAVIDVAEGVTVSDLVDIVPPAVVAVNENIGVSDQIVSKVFGPPAIGTVVFSAKLTASDGAAGDKFGSSAGLSGDTLVLGAPFDGPADRGSVYVFVRSGTGWTQQARLVADDAVDGDNFGVAVAVLGDTIVVGAERSDPLGSDSGAAYVFTRSGSNWTQLQKLVAGSGGLGQRFGNVVAISGETIVVAARSDDSAYVFVRSGSSWTQQVKLFAKDAVGSLQFGESVGIDGDTVVIGAVLDPTLGTQAGSAYVFVRSGSTWSQQAKLLASDGAALDHFGSAAAISGDTIAVGADLADIPVAGVGAAYVFVRSEATWTQQAKLLPVDWGSGDAFGTGVGLSGDTLLVGAFKEDNSAVDSGAAYIFVRSGANWTQQQKLKSSQPGALARFGNAVAIGGATVLVAAFQDDDLGSLSGSADVFTVPQADVAAIISGSTDSVSVGDSLTYSVTIVNNGPIEATSVMLIDTLPAHTSFVAASLGCGHSGGVVTCNLGALADDVTARLTITVRVLNSASESLTNSVAVAASESDPNPTNNDHLALTTVVAGNPPAFDVPATPPSGATFTMIAGESLQFNVQVSDFDIQADVTQITAGTDHTCALLDTGVVRCWGWGGLSQLGYGNISSIGDNETPADAGDVDVGGAVVQIDAGHAHTCAVLDTGAVRCWGSGGFSNLGYGNTSNIGDNETPATAGDVDVGGTVAQIASGTFHTCALLDTGAVRCCGAGGAGRLGYNNAIAVGDNETPATAYASLPNGGDVGVGGTVAQIAVSKHHTCALLDTGAVRCWGLGTNGRLGYATTTNIGDDETPADAGDVDVGGTVAQIVAGEEHTCALLDTGAVRCWGVGGSGRLGYGNDNNIGDDETPASAGDVAVGGTVVQIDAGGFHTCALLDTGAVRCWGAGGAGRLGYGNTLNIGGNATPASAYASMPNGGNVDIGGIAVQIATGSHTCALLDTGAVRCWGSSGSLNPLGPRSLRYAIRPASSIKYSRSGSAA